MSNRKLNSQLRTKVLEAYRRRYPDFGPTLAVEKLETEGLKVSVETLRRWLLAEGLWERKRHRDPHRSRRPRRSCLGELVQMDASIHDWLEGRGETVVLITMIDDATSGGVVDKIEQDHEEITDTVTRVYMRRAVMDGFVYDKHDFLLPDSFAMADEEGDAKVKKRWQFS
jgi:hypothetical protein